jgi:CDP-diacylglycerol---serine O-phosphatidyltransferase
MSTRLHSVIVNGCTSLNLTLGVSTIILAHEGCLKLAALCLLGSVMWDAADGYLARRWNVTSDFGANLDSLADMTSFVVGGSALTFNWFEPFLPLWATLPLAVWFALTGAWRLARFNAGPKLTGEFFGLPTTANATLLAMLLFTCPQLPSWSGALVIAFLAWLMISPLPYPKFYRVKELPTWFLASLPVFACVHFHATVWACSALYLMTGPWIWLRRRNDAPGVPT